MSPDANRDAADALAALQRLHHHGVIPLEDAREAARLISGDASYEFPSAAPPAAAAEEGGASVPS